MTMHERLEKAISFAVEKHMGQVDKGGYPYILHPLWVMNQVLEKYGDPELAAIAVLHDVLEDTDATVIDLHNIKMSSRIILGVVTLTRLKDDHSYTKYIERIARSKDATIVKMEDLRHNMDIGRLQYVGSGTQERVYKYAKALSYLSIERLHQTKQGEENDEV